jgi:hypothetical protein
MFGSTSRYRLYARASGNASEELQTDVMRFMAILGLSLTAIFALIQSLPLQPADPRPHLETPAALGADIAIQQKRLELLQAQVNALEGELTEGRRQLDQIRDQSDKVQRQHQQDLRALEAELNRRRSELASIERARQEGERSLVELRRNLRVEKRALDELENKLSVTPTADEEEPLPRPPAPIEDPQPVQTEDGLALRFASAEALRGLVATGDVGFFALIGKRVWRLSIASGQPLFERTEPPAQFYEMTPVTVPADFWDTFQRKAAVYDRQRVTWGVSLPAALRAEIDAAVRGRAAGELIIQEDGRLALPGAIEGASSHVQSGP